MAKKQVIEGVFEEVSAGLVKYEGDAKSEMQTEKASASEMLDAIRGMPIESQGDLDLAAEALAQIKGEIKRLDERRKRVTAPLNSALSEVRSWFKPALDFYSDAEILLKKRISEYHAQCEAQNRAALESAATAAAHGDRAAISEALAEINVPEKVVGLSIREAWDFEVEDVAIVPKQFLMVNETAVREAMRATAAQTKDGVPNAIPGLKFFKKTIIASRAK